MNDQFVHTGLATHLVLIPQEMQQTSLQPENP